MAANNPDVLLIEDSPGDAELKYDSLIGTEAADIGLAWNDRPAKALRRIGIEKLLDLATPDCWEPDTPVNLHAQLPSVPVAEMTGIDIEDFAVEAVRLGAQGYLVNGDVSPDKGVRALRFAVERQVPYGAG